jgi:hypothetical protein
LLPTEIGYYWTGPLLSSLAEKDLKYNVTKNPFDIGRSILWKMEVPDDIAQEVYNLNEGCDTVMHISFVHL